MKNIENRSQDIYLDSIKIGGKNFLRRLVSFVDEESGQIETIRIYATDEMLEVLEDKNYNQFFIDGTFKCVPKGNTKNPFYAEV